MDFFATLRRSGGINALARQLGIAPGVATAGAQALLPQLLDGFRPYRARMPELLDILNDLGGGALAVTVMNMENADPAPGLALIGRIFEHNGSVEELMAAARPSAIERTSLERMAPLLAMLIGGYVAARAAGGMDAAALGEMFDARDAAGTPV